MDIGFIYAIGAAIIWGLVYAIDQKILATVSPMTLLFINSIMAVCIMFPFIFFDNGSVKTLFASGRNTIFLILISAILIIIANFLIFTSIKQLDASTASIVEIAYPFFVVLFSLILFKSTPNPSFFIGGLLIFVGSVIIIKFS